MVTRDSGPASSPLTGASRTRRLFAAFPDAVPDANGDGRFNRRDLKALGVASNIVRVPFHINADQA